MELLFKNTPLIKIVYEYNGKIKEIYAKLEYYSLTGSIKDKVVYYILKKAFDNKEFEYGMPIIEASSGNTGISAAAIGAYYKSPVYIFMPSWVTKERKKLLSLYGAKIKTYSKKQGGFLKCIEEANKLALKIDGFMINQFSNYDNVLAHQKYTFEEITKKLNKVDLFVVGIGTGGTLTGCGKKLKSKYNSKIIAVTPKTKHKNHKIDGISDGFIPNILDEKLIHETIEILDDDAINMCIKFSEEIGLGIGISSAANFIGAVLSNEKYNSNKTVTIFPDDNKKYLSVLKYKKRNNDYFNSNDIKLLTFDVI